MPFTEGRVVQLLENLYEEAMQQCDAAGERVPSVEQMLAVRDGLAFSFAYTCSSPRICALHAILAGCASLLYAGPEHKLDCRRPVL